jgi:predicted nucleic acid-binding protein
VTHLDTSFLVRAFVAGTPQSVRLDRWLDEERLLGISAPAWAEFMCGPVPPAVVRAAADALGIPVPFGVQAAVTVAECFNSSGRRRRTMVDCMIAATAITDAADLATSNVADFERFVPLGLRLAT